MKSLNPARPPNSVRWSLLVGMAWASMASTATAQSQIASPQDPESDPAQVDDVIVTGVPFGINARATTLATTVFNEETLAVAPATSLGDLVNGLPGVRSTAFAPGASRPVIRGLSGPRVQVLTNGMGLIDASSVSPDHQVAADPAEAQRIEIIRGPATLAFGGTAIGGVINVMDGRIPVARPDGPDGRLSAQASSGDNGRAVSARVSAPVGPFVFTLNAVDKASDDYAIPTPAVSRRLAERDGLARIDTGRQANSFSELQTWGIGAAWLGERGLVGASFKDLASSYGIVAEHEVFVRLDQQRLDLRGELILQAGPFQRLTGAFGQADYTHTEFEGPGQPGTVFNSQGREVRLEFVQRARGGWNGAIGLQALTRDFIADGDEAYVPASEIEEVGLYAMQRLDRPSWGLEGGLRLDRRDVGAVPLMSAMHVQRSFANVSGSAAVFLRPGPGLFLGLSLSHNARAPSEVELFADGLHIATGAYEVGEPALTNETVNMVEGTVHFDAGRLRGDLHLYGSRFDGFIDLRPTGTDHTDDGQTYPVMAYVQTDADLWGLEAEVGYDLWTSGIQTLSLEGAADFVSAETDLGPVARIPPWSLTARLAWTSSPLDATLEVRHVAEQTRLAAFELPTDPYTLVNLSTEWRPFADPRLTLFAQGANLTNQEAREHVSFLKDVAPLPGRNVRLGLSYAF